MTFFSSVVRDVGAIYFLDATKIFDINLRPFNDGYQALLVYSDPANRAERKVAMAAKARCCERQALRSLLEMTGKYVTDALATRTNSVCGLHKVFSDGVEGMDYELLRK